MTFTEAEVNAALRTVDAAKQRFPDGWHYLNRVGLDPADSFVVYAFDLGRAHTETLEALDDPALVYATGWLQGLSVGVVLGGPCSR